MNHKISARPAGRAHVPKGLYTIALSVGLILQPGNAAAQRAGENAVSAAEDAFGGSVGRENTGVYSEGDIRGFSPQKAGNVRIEGVYFDPVAPFTGLLRAYSTMRVGFAALDFPFPAPSGIVDYKLRTAGNDLIRSVSFDRTNYGGTFTEANMQLPLIKDKLSVAAGMLHNYATFVDGASLNYISVAVRPTLRLSNLEVSPFFTATTMRDAFTRPIITTTGPFLPPMTESGDYLGQDWVDNSTDNSNHGVTGRAQLFTSLSFRGGAFHSRIYKRRNFVELFRVLNTEGLADHIVVADPPQDTYSNSWEGQFAWNRSGKAWQNRFIVGARGRDRHTESGGSVSRNLGQVILGQHDPEQESEPTFGPVNLGTVKQTHLMGGYFGRLHNVRVNLGMQKVKYEATFRSPLGVTSSTADPWLYNVNVRFDPTKMVSLYAGYVRGLEDSGTAPETAANRNEQLPATLTEQIDAGLRFDFGDTAFVASAFHLTKPYFTFDTGNVFGQIGTVRHRGVEFSLSGRPTERLQLIAGAILLDAAVSGSAVNEGRLGERPVGTSPYYFRIDANYRTDIGAGGSGQGLTPTLSILHTGKRAASAAPFAALGAEQLTTNTRTTVDIGARYGFRLGDTNLGLRATLANVFDDATWRVLASNQFQMDERRRFQMQIVADF